MIRKWCFLIFISNCIFFNNQVVKAESIQGRGLPAVDHETERLDSLYKKREEIHEAMLDIDKEIFKLQKMIIEKSVNEN